jgi:hypothetical protein
MPHNAMQCMAYPHPRFKQLEVADALRLWNEGFRIVEDIYTLMQVRERLIHLSIYIYVYVCVCVSLVPHPHAGTHVHVHPFSLSLYMCE